MKIIARLHSDFPEKFGIPRQSGLVKSLQGRIVFEPEYRDLNALRGLEDYSHIWVIWEFSEAKRERWSATVRPPRLGGNTHMGVFATRSPFRPNPLGLSCLELERIETDTSEGPILHVRGADLMDGTPIFDIKPYLPYADSHPEARGPAFIESNEREIEVHIPELLMAKVAPEKHAALLGVLQADPRPAYRDDAERVYGLHFAGMNIRFQVIDRILQVVEINKT